MTLHRFFTDELMPDAGVVPLAEADIHHLRDVLRLEPGDEVIIVHAGTAAVVRLIDVGERVLGERVGEVQTTHLPRVTLVQGLAKGEKMDDVVRQVTELGVSRIVPFAAERSVVKLDPSKAAARIERWKRVAAEAAKQSQRFDLPEIHPVVRTQDLPAVLAGSKVLVCWEDARDALGIGEALRLLAPGDDIDAAVVVGPEGGLSQGEVALLQAAGAVTVTLGSTVLRTETAGVVATAIALYERGGLGGRDA